MDRLTDAQKIALFEELRDALRDLAGRDHVTNATAITTTTVLFQK